MNCSGVFRRIDELGRIVIPVEIRRILNIKEGENLEFYINNGEINLRKKSVILDNKEFLEKIFNSIGSIIDGEIFISDREKIIFASDVSNIGKPLSNDILSLLTDYNDMMELNNIEVIKENYNGISFVYPYYLNSDISGFIVLYKIDDISKYNKLIKFIINYINNEFKI